MHPGFTQTNSSPATMETSGGITDASRNQTDDAFGAPPRRFGFFPSNLSQALLSALLAYSGILQTRAGHSESQRVIGGSGPERIEELAARGGPGNGEVDMRIIGAGDEEGLMVGPIREQPVPGSSGHSSELHGGSFQWQGRDLESDSSSSSFANASISAGGGPSTEGEATGAGGNNGDSPYQTYDIQQTARCIEQFLPFSLLHLVVLIKQHLQGFFITIWIVAVMFKSNDIVKKQTALKGERRIAVLTGITLTFMIHVFGVYWWYRNDDLLYPLVMLPPKKVPPFWHAIFIIMVNDTIVRQAAMVVKCVLLMFYKNSRGLRYREQGQMLTLVEYLLLLYRTLLPTPVWYRFFLNKEYGSYFSSLITGLYLTFKLTSLVGKVQSFFAALKAVLRKVHYGSYATMEQVIAVGSVCAICQERMRSPILLSCKHIFCEDCVSDWFDRERTCPLCRALVEPADFKSFADGHTSLFFQLF